MTQYNKNSLNSINGDFDILYVSEELNIPSNDVDDPVDESTEGDIYFNTANKKLKVFDGTNWQNVDSVTGPFQLAGNPNYPTPGPDGSLSYDNNQLIFNNHTNVLPIPSIVSCYMNECKFAGVQTTSFGDVNVVSFDRIRCNGIPNNNLSGFADNRIAIFSNDVNTNQFEVVFPGLDANNPVDGVLVIGNGWKTAQYPLFCASEIQTYNTNYGTTYGFSVHVFRDFETQLNCVDIANPFCFNILASFW